MAGRQWHWLAAATAAVAVIGAVLFNDTTTRSSFSSHPFAAADYAPEVGRPVLATPTIDATTVTKHTPPAVPAPPAKPTSSAAPPPSTPSSTPKPPGKPPKITITLTVPEIPVFYPDCATARFLGVAPIERDEPGYREELDRDHDGVACEVSGHDR